MHGRWAQQKCWHLVSRITDIRRSRMPGDRRCQPQPRSERGAGTGSDLTLGPGSDCGCSGADPFASARTPQPRAHRYNVPTPPSAQSGATIHPGRRTSTDAAGVWPAVGIAYPHSHPTQTWCRSSRRSQPCVAGCRKGKETCCMLMLMYACPSARVAPLPGAAAAVGTNRCWVAGDWACRSHR